MSGFSQAVLDKAAAKQRKAAEKRSVSAEVGAGGVRTHQVDSILFHQGVAYGREHGVHQPWDDPNFVQEVEKVHPEIVVGSGGGGCSPVTASALEAAKRLVSRM